jgi:predicted SAM-dependent methyltransferase
MPLLRGELNRLRLVTRPWVVRRYLRRHADRKLHLGCGRVIVPGWLNADKFAPEADIYLDAYHRLPFPDGVFDCVYMEHLIEHIRIERVPGFLGELARVLRPGGLLRLTCPDLELFARMYCENRAEFFAPILERFAQARPRHPQLHWLVRTKGGAWNTRAVQRFYHHRWFYDFETLAACLSEVGFADVRRQGFGASLREEAGRLDSPQRRPESLYLDAIR